jgi:hypothetical protein
MQGLPSSMTCISIADSIPAESKEGVLIDALYLLYFVVAFREVYYDQEIPSIEPYTKYILAENGLVLDKTHPVTCIHRVSSLCDGLGLALEKSPTDPNARRMIRSVRYFVDQFFKKFVNLSAENGGKNYLPENLLSLATSLEGLFDISEKTGYNELRQKLRLMLHLNFSTPLEILWKWVDEFYELKEKIIRGKETSEVLFQANPNFIVSHLYLGVKLYIYSVYFHLFKYQLKQIRDMKGAKSETQLQNLFRFIPQGIPSIGVGKEIKVSLPEKIQELKKLEHAEEKGWILQPEFSGIHPDEFLMYFWTQTSILRKLASFLKQSKDNLQQQDLKSDLKFLSHLYVSILKKGAQIDAWRRPDLATFIPADNEELSSVIQEILSVSQGKESFLFEEFIPSLKSEYHP